MKETITDGLRVFVVPVQVLEDQNLTGNEKLVYVVLRSFCNAHRDEAFPSHNTISFLSGLSNKTVRRCINSLVDKDYLNKEVRWDYNHRTKASRQTSNLYKLVLPVVTQTAHPWSDRPSPMVTQTSHEQDHLTGQEGTKCNVMSDPADRQFIINFLTSKAEKMVVNEHLEFSECIQDVASGLMRRKRLDREIIMASCEVWIQRQFDNHCKYHSYIDVKKAPAFFMNCYDEAAAAAEKKEIIPMP